MPAALLWLACAAVAAALPYLAGAASAPQQTGAATLSRGAALHPLLEWAVAAVVLAAAAVAALVASGRAPRELRRRLGTLLVFGTPLTLLLLVAAGGLSAPAAAPLGALLVLGVAWQSGPRSGLVAAAAVPVLLSIADMWLGRPHDPAALVAVVVVIAGGAVGPELLSRRRAAEDLQARRRLARVDGYLVDRNITPIAAVAVPSDLRRSARLAHREAEGLRDLETLDVYLREVRDELGADEVIFWRWHEGRATQIPAAWSSEGAGAPIHFAYEKWAPLVKWAAEGGLVQCAADTDAVRFAAAPVQSRHRMLGVLSVSSAAGMQREPDEIKGRLTARAAHVTLLVELLEVRRAYRRDRGHAQALVRAAERIQSQTSQDALAKAICATALEISAAARAVLVRWDDVKAAGRVEASAGTKPAPEGLRVTDDSLVGAACGRGLPLCKENARRLRPGELYGPGEPVRQVGSLAVVPLRRERSVLGAIVIEADRPDEIGSAEMQAIQLLGALAAASVETLEEVSRRAQTDQLTGLANRRHFDEQLTRMLAEADRFGHPVSLVLADIDHFKAVNDSHGHPAGDAALRAIAVIFREKARAVDLCARYGGEEMAVLLPHTDEAGATELAERLRRAIESRPVSTGGLEIPLTASLGVASYPACVSSHDELVAAADRALYQAKARGRNCVMVAPAKRSSTAT